MMDEIKISVFSSKFNRYVRKVSDAWHNKSYEHGISFCIPTNGRRPDKTLLELKSIRATMKKSGVPYEIIIAGDTDNYKSVKGVQLVNTPEDAHNGLLAKLRNSAAEHTQYEIIVFADDDLLFEEDWSQRLVEFSNGSNWDVLGNRVLLPNGGRYWDRCTYAPHELIDYESDSHPGTLYQSGAFWLVKRRVYTHEKWDPRIKFYGEKSGGLNEDVEYSIRLQKRGFVISFDQKNLVWHDDDTYIEDVEGKRVIKLGTKGANDLQVLPVMQRFKDLKANLAK